MLCELGLGVGCPLVGVLGRGEQPDRAVWPVGVVVDASVLDEDLGFEEAVELPAVEELVAESPVERLDPGVLPGRPGVDEAGRDIVESAPVRDGPRDELGTVVEPDERWRSAALCSDRVEGRDDTVGVDATVNFDREGFAGELVNRCSTT